MFSISFIESEVYFLLSTSDKNLQLLDFAHQILKYLWRPTCNDFILAKYFYKTDQVNALHLHCSIYLLWFTYQFLPPCACQASWRQEDVSERLHYFVFPISNLFENQNRRRCLSDQVEKCRILRHNFVLNFSTWLFFWTFFLVCQRVMNNRPFLLKIKPLFKE